MILTNEQSNILTEMAGPLLADMAAGADAVDTLASFYSKHLGCPIKFGRIHVAQTQKVIQKLQEKRPVAQEDLFRFCLEHDPTHLHWTESVIWEGSGWPAGKLWLRVDAAVTLSGITVGGKTVRRDNSVWTLERALQMLQEDMTPLTAELNLERRKQAIQSIQDSGLLLPGLRGMAQTLQGLASRQGGGRMLLELGNKSVPLGLTAAVLAEVEAEAGKFKDIQHMYSLLWAGQELLVCMEAVGNGEMPVAQGAELVRRVGQLLIIVAIVHLYMDGLPVVRQLSILDSAPGYVELVVEVMSCVFRAASPMLQDSSLELEPQMVDLEAAAKGAEVMAEYAEKQIIPQIEKQSAGHLDQLLSMAEDFASRA